jgi:hypothetical protein
VNPWVPYFVLFVGAFLVWRAEHRDKLASDDRVTQRDRQLQELRESVRMLTEEVTTLKEEDRRHSWLADQRQQTINDMTAERFRLLPIGATGPAAPITDLTTREEIPFENPVVPSPDNTTGLPTRQPVEDDATS